jgi:uncharacterized protein YjbI with pentapeptide repeats
MTVYDLTDYDLTDYDLTDYNLTDYDLTDYDLTDYNLTDYDLTDYDLTDFDLTDLSCVVKTVRTTRLNLDPCRKVSNVNLEMTDSVVETTLELDSHADTCVLGRHALITLDYD